MSITEDLQRYAETVMPSYPDDICSRAKVEIERLRRDVEEARAGEARLRTDRDGLAVTVTELEAGNAKLSALWIAETRENEKLRTALKPFAKEAERFAVRGFVETSGLAVDLPGITVEDLRRAHEAFGDAEQKEQEKS